MIEHTISKMTGGTAHYEKKKAYLLANDHHTPYSFFDYPNMSYASKRWSDLYLYSQWNLDRDGGCYCWWNAQLKEGNNGEYTFMKIEPSGEVAYDVLLENDTGVLDGTDVAVDFPWLPGMKLSAGYSCCFGADGEGNLYLISQYGNESGIYRVDLSDGSVSGAISFTGTTYTIGSSTLGDSAIDLASDFVRGDLLVLPDGGAEVLWRTKTYGASHRSYPVILGVRETLRPVSADRPVVTIRAESFSTWMKKQAVQFNKSNPRWQVVLEEYTSSNAADLEEYARLTSVQIATGKGPDMLYGSFMDSYVPGMLEKGVLLELSGPLVGAGVRAEECVRLQAKRVIEENKVQVDGSYIDGGEFVKDKRIYTAADMTEDRIREYLDALEDVRAVPARNRPVIDIICEEAEYYFNGDKSIKEVVKVIKSKVGLYLAERQ